MLYVCSGHCWIYSGSRLPFLISCSQRNVKPVSTQCCNYSLSWSCTFQRNDALVVHISVLKLTPHDFGPSHPWHSASQWGSSAKQHLQSQGSGSGVPNLDQFGWYWRGKITTSSVVSWAHLHPSLNGGVHSHGTPRASKIRTPQFGTASAPHMDYMPFVGHTSAPGLYAAHSCWKSSGWILPFSGSELS